MQAGRVRLRRRAVPAQPAIGAPAPESRVLLRTLERSDRDAFLALARDSRELHRPWTYPPERPEQFEELYSRSRRDDFVCLVATVAGTDELVGVFTISQIFRGAFQSA